MSIKNKIKNFKAKSKEFFRKLASICLVLLITISNIIPTWAEPTSNVTELRTAVENRLSTFNQVDLSKYGGVLGVFHNMKVILSQALWTDFILQDNTLGIPDATKNYQKEMLVKRIREFNEAFHQDNEKYKGVTLDISSVGDVDGEQLNNFSLSNIVNDIANYSKTYIEGLLKDKEEDEVVTDYKSELRYIYQIVNTCVTEVKTINSLIPAKETEKDGLITVEPETPYSPNSLTPLSSLLDDKANAQISKVLRKCQELADDELQEITPDNIDNSKELLDRFYKNGTFTSKELINSYFMIFSASATYEPFVSHVGDDSFVTALRQMSGETGSDSKLIELFNDAKRYKKPLYYRELDRDGKPKGAAERITLGSFVDYMLKDSSGVLVMPVGVYEQPADSNSYMIYQSNRYYYTGDESINNSNSNDSNSNNDSNSSNDSSDNSDSTNANNNNSTGGDADNLVTPEGISGEEVLPNAPEDTESTDAKSNRQTKEEWKKSLEDVESFSHDMPITNEAYMTSPVFGWSKTSQYFLGTVIGRNIVSDVAKVDKFSKDNGLLFMNCFGDIVTEDDTVIIPGACNSTFYNEEQYYYPYTFAFMKSYPSIKLGTKIFESTNEKDTGKYILAINNNEDGDSDKTKQEKEDESLTEQISGTKLTDNNDYEIIARKINSMYGLTYDSQTSLSLKLQATMKQMGDGKPSMLTFKHFEFENKDGGWFSGITNWMRDLANNSASSNWLGDGTEMIMVKDLQSTYSNQTKTVLFDTDLEDMQDQDLGIVASNFYWGIMSDDQGNMLKPNEKLNTELLAKEVVPEALNGLQDAVGYAKNTFDYEDMVEDQFNRVTNVLQDIVQSIINTPASVRGVLGLESAYQNPIFGKILVQYKTYIPIIAVLVIVLCIIRYMNSRTDLGQLAVVVIATLACSIFFTSVFPVYIPMTYNVAISEMAKDLGYTSLLMKSEDYDNLMQEKQNSKGEVELHTMSINLYKLNNDDLEYVCDKLNITPADAGNGTAYPLDASNGLYLEGNIVKLNLDKLFGNLPIVGSYKAGNNGKAYYQLEMQKRQSNNVDYYMPYYLITQSFIDKLNDLCKVYELNRSTVKYDRMVKDSFVVNAYINSAPFLIPGEFDKMAETIEPAVLENIKTVFGDTDDWLGLSSFLAEPMENGQDSLWYRTLMQNGFIHDDMYTLGEDSSEEAEKAREKMNKLISEINYLTKQFILTNQDSFVGMSDENLIKIISLHATLIFNQKVGDRWANLYPMFLNTEELTLNDILVAAYTSNSDRFRSEEMNIVSYITYKYEWFGLIVLLLIVLLTSFSTLVIKLFVPILYVLLFVFSAFKFAGKRQLDSVARGFMKCSLTLLLLFTLNVLGIYLAFKLDGSWTALGIQFLLVFNITDTLLKLIGAVLRDLTNLGDSQFHTVAPWMLQATGMLDAMDDLRVKTTNIVKGRKPQYIEGFRDKAYDRFKHSRNMDEFYESEVIMRGSLDKHRKRTDEFERNVKSLHDEYEDFRNI